MSEDSSSDEEWCVSSIGQINDLDPKAKCWECGETFSKITTLMSHYKSHNINATCHICEVTFRRLTSLSTHLDNAHSPPFCKKCHQSFSNVWDLNKHAEKHCMVSAAPSLISALKYQSQNSDNFSTEVRVSVSEMRRRQRIEMKPETSGNSVEYIVGEDDKEIDMESDFEMAEDSDSSVSDDEEKTHSKPADDPESDGGSSSTDDSSECSNSPPSKPPNAVLPNTNKNSICTTCGRGPFRSLKLHLLHCSGVRVKYQCFLCKELFQTETLLNEHYMSLYSCDVCGQVFSNEIMYRQHPCPKKSKSPLALFCAETMPQVCNICKSFFTSEKTLFNHVTRVHTSVVSTKVCIITNPSALTDKKVASAAQAATSIPNVLNQVVNGKLHDGQSYASSLSTSLSTAPSAASARSGKDSAQDQPPIALPPDTTPATSQTSDPDSTQMPTIMAMFENDSQDVALMKRMNTGWRSKTPYVCRQCGAVFRQPSLIISHRYLHRGPRVHQCQCGRAFKHRLHLLRHCVQHAESMNYICVSCGETFTGAKVLAEHIKGKSRKKSSSGRTWKRKVKRKCRMPFSCDCGQLFFRPSAFIWHQLKNRTKTKHLKKPSK
uniref:zinc finger protein 27 n=1 Tax=Semicossyphus pulcher TaxID=241346 RepID=UPI0037E98902